MTTVTVVILHDDRLCEHFAGAVEGTVSQAARRRLAKAYNASLDYEEGGRTLYFREVDLAPKAEALGELLNIQCDE